jgi:hypothetical protein
MGQIALACGAAITAAFFLGVTLGRAAIEEAHRRQIDAARDAVSRVANDFRTQPHTKDAIERSVYPLLAERKR